MNRLSLQAIIWIVLAWTISGCVNSPSTPQVVVDESLPSITQIRTLADINQIGLEWTPQYDEKIQGYYIYRSQEGSQNRKLKRVATIKDRYSSHYVDKSLTPNTMYHYKITTYSNSKKESIPSQMVSVSTNATIEPIPFIEAITGLPNRAKIIWRPHPNVAVSSYIVQRSKPDEQKWKKIATVHGRLSAEYIDKGLDDNDIFRYRVLAKTDQGILSKPSQEVISRTKPLPPRVEHISVTNNLPKKIALSWAEVQGDISYYKIYSSPTSMLLFTYLAKTEKTSYEDLINSNGSVRYYKITAVDKDGLESLKQKDSVAGSTLPSPTTPELFEARIDMNNIILTWSQTDDRAKRFNIIKKYNEKTVIIKNQEGSTYIDTNVEPNISYKYRVVAIDKYGLVSESSNSITAKIP